MKCKQCCIKCKDYLCASCCIKNAFKPEYGDWQPTPSNCIYCGYYPVRSESSKCGGCEK